MTNPKDVLKHHVTGAIDRGEGKAIEGKPVPVQHMGAYRAVEILDGFGEPPRDAAEVIEAARWIRDNGPRAVACKHATRNAIALADLADSDYDAAIDSLEQSNG